MTKTIILQKAATQDPFLKTTVIIGGRQIHSVGGGKRTMGFTNNAEADLFAAASGEVRAADTRDGDLGGNRNVT